MRSAALLVREDGSEAMGVRKPIRPSGSVEEESPGSSLESLYRRYAGWLTGVLRRQLGPLASEADDLVQETYIRVARYADEDAARHPQALLKRIGVNLARDHMRRHVIRGGKAGAHETGEAQASLDHHRVEPDQETTLILKQTVLGLPPLYRDVFLLSRFTGMTYEEIARHLGVSVKTVEWRMSRALKMCADRLRD